MRCHTLPEAQHFQNVTPLCQALNPPSVSMMIPIGPALGLLASAELPGPESGFCDRSRKVVKSCLRRTTGQVYDSARHLLTIGHGARNGASPASEAVASGPGSGCMRIPP